MPRAKRPAGEAGRWSPDFLGVLAAIGTFVAMVVLLIRDDTPQSVRIAALAVVGPVTALLLVGVWGGLLILPAWAVWRAARVADAKSPPPGGALTVAPDEGALAPDAVRRSVPAPVRWKSLEWTLTGLGLAGEAGFVLSLVLGNAHAAWLFGVIFLIGGGGWILKLNRDHLRERTGR